MVSSQQRVPRNWCDNIHLEDYRLRQFWLDENEPAGSLVVSSCTVRPSSSWERGRKTLESDYSLNDGRWLLDSTRVLIAHRKLRNGKMWLKRYITGSSSACDKGWIMQRMVIFALALTPWIIARQWYRNCECLGLHLGSSCNKSMCFGFF